MLIWQALARGGFNISEDYQLRGEYGVDSFDDVFEWLNQNVPKPTEQEVVAWWSEVELENNQKELVATEKETISNLFSDALEHASKIRLVFSAIVLADRLQHNVDSRFLGVTAALSDATIGAGFRTLVMDAFTSETGLTFPMTQNGINNAPTATRQAFNSFCGRFFTRWVLMVLFAKI